MIFFDGENFYLDQKLLNLQSDAHRGRSNPIETDLHWSSLV